MEDKLIGTREAAEMLGVSTTTVRTMAMGGILPCRRDSQIFKFKLEDVKALVKDTEGIREAETSLHEIEERLREEARYKHVTLAEMYERRQEYLEKQIPGRSLVVAMSIWQKLYQTFLQETADDDPLTSREWDIIRMCLEGYQLDYIQVKEGLTRERVRWIKEKALRKLKRMRSLQQIICDRDAEIVKLKTQIEKMRNENDTLKSYININRPENEPFDNEDEDIAKIQEAVEKARNVSIDDLDLSTRAYRILKKNKVQTLTDICKYRHRELMRFHNMGKKTLYEIETILDKHGLQLKK